MFGKGSGKLGDTQFSTNLCVLLGFDIMKPQCLKLYLALGRIRMEEEEIPMTLSDDLSDIQNPVN